MKFCSKKNIDINILQTLSENILISIIDRVDHVCIFMKELHIQTKGKFKLSC
jgi:hypothetical protein